MSVKKKDKLDEMIAGLEHLFKVDNDEEKIELKTSIIQLDILDEVKKLMVYQHKKMTLTELAAKLGKSKSFVSQIFSGDKSINLKMIAHLEGIFKVKFIPSFKDINTYTVSRRITKETYYTNSDYSLGKTPIFDISDYQEVKVA